VAGNHDTFGLSLTPPRSLANRQYVHYLDGDIADAGGLTVAGVGGIIGNPRKPHRRSDEEYVRVVHTLLERRPDVLLMHDGPDIPVKGYRGSPLVREAIEQCDSRTLVVRGHAHWPEPLVELPGGTQVLNVDARVVVLRKRSG
jgi:Icc-related predicted phosphoesterase